MKPEDLRIGNLIEKYGKPIKVDLGIWTKINNGSVIYKPIELTEEWLFKLGFEKNNGLWTTENFPSYFTKFTKEPGCYEFFVGRISIVKCKYVHQLQNLYYSLIGYELELKNEEQ